MSTTIKNLSDSFIDLSVPFIHFQKREASRLSFLLFTSFPYNFSYNEFVKFTYGNYR